MAKRKCKNEGLDQIQKWSGKIIEGLLPLDRDKKLRKFLMQKF